MKIVVVDRPKFFSFFLRKMFGIKKLKPEEIQGLFPIFSINEGLFFHSPFFVRIIILNMYIIVVYIQLKIVSNFWSIDKLLTNIS